MPRRQPRHNHIELWGCSHLYSEDFLIYKLLKSELNYSMQLFCVISKERKHSNDMLGKSTRLSDALFIGHCGVCCDYCRKH